MSNIILPESDKSDSSEETEIKYKATEADEERFFLMYQMKFQPSEVEKLDPEYRKWLIARFVAQKSMEREMFEQQRLMSQIAPGIKA